MEPSCLGEIVAQSGDDSTHWRKHCADLGSVLCCVFHLAHGVWQNFGDTAVRMEAVFGECVPATILIV